MHNECWLEIDIYWFQGDEPSRKVKEFFDRLEPIYRLEPQGRKGISLCAGWLCDSVLLWNGDLDDMIHCCQPPLYERWTYRRLLSLIICLKVEAENRNLTDFHVALMLVGWITLEYDENACEGWSGRTEEVDAKPKYNIRGKWLVEHPEVFDSRYGVFYFGSKISKPQEDRICQLDTPTFGEYFSEKLCHLSKCIGIDAVVFRDGIFTPAYIRGGSKRYIDTHDGNELSQSFIELFRRVKNNIPDFIIIGYSSGTSPIEEWRSHGFDLEKVAMSGYLDIWITQTWASAWQDYWPCHSMGYTFQLSNVLVNMAMLINTPCKHLFLIETFDAWEPWDSIHQYPSKVKWEMWAYSHSAVIRPNEDVCYSDGYYISWMNHGQELLKKETVELISNSLNEINADLEHKPIPGGPSLVYDRSGMEKLVGTPESYSQGEEIGDWSAMLLKYATPILSITRGEWLQRVVTEGVICPTTLGLDKDQSLALIELIERGTPVLFMGKGALLSDPLKEKLGVHCLPEPVSSQAHENMLSSHAHVSSELAREIGTTGLIIHQAYRTLDDSDDWTTLIECLGGPVFVKKKNVNCWIWETPEWGTLDEMNLTCESIQSTQTFYAVALSLNKSGWGNEKIMWTNHHWKKPVCFLLWRYPSGETGVLLGNLETGITGNSQFCTRGNIVLEDMYGKVVVNREEFSYGRMLKEKDKLEISLGAHKACLFKLRG